MWPMRELPNNVDADVVIEIGRYLDDHGRGTAVSMSLASSAIRRRVKTSMNRLELEQLIMESAAARQMAMLLDTAEQ